MLLLARAWMVEMATKLPVLVPRRWIMERGTKNITSSSAQAEMVPILVTSNVLHIYHVSTTSSCVLAMCPEYTSFLLLQRLRSHRGIPVSFAQTPFVGKGDRVPETFLSRTTYVWYRRHCVPRHQDPTCSRYPSPKNIIKGGTTLLHRHRLK